MLDKELEEYKRLIGADNYKREYNSLYIFAKQNKTRYSKKDYKNSKEKLKEIKEKYKNGVDINDINEMLGIKN